MDGDFTAAVGLMRALLQMRCATWAAGGVAAGSSDENHFPDRQQGFEILVCCISF
jgi:hypothetical protein